MKPRSKKFRRRLQAKRKRKREQKIVKERELISSIAEEVVEILSWLPEKSLKRFQCVCKAWFLLLTKDSYFSNLHAHRGKHIPDDEGDDYTFNGILRLFEGDDHTFNGTIRRLKRYIRRLERCLRRLEPPRRPLYSFATLHLSFLKSSARPRRKRRVIAQWRDEKFSRRFQEQLLHHNTDASEKKKLPTMEKSKNKERKQDVDKRRKRSTSSWNPHLKMHH